MPPPMPGGQLGLEDLAGLDRGPGVVLVVQREQLARLEAEDAGQGAQVAAGVEVAAARREVVDLDALQDVRADPGAVAERVDAQPGAVAGGGDQRADDRLGGRLRGAARRRRGRRRDATTTGPSPVRAGPGPASTRPARCRGRPRTGRRGGSRAPGATGAKCTCGSGDGSGTALRARTGLDRTDLAQRRACSSVARAPERVSASSRSTAVTWCGQHQAVVALAAAEHDDLDTGHQDGAGSSGSAAVRRPRERPRLAAVLGLASLSGSTSSRLDVARSSVSVSAGPPVSAAAGSSRVTTTTGVRPLASASRSATRSPVSPSKRSLVVGASGTEKARARGSPPRRPRAGARRSGRRAATRPARAPRRGRCPASAGPTRSRHGVRARPGRRPASAAPGCRGRRAAARPRPTPSTTHQDQSSTSPACSARANQATVITAAASATPVASRERCSTATPRCGAVGWRRSGRVPWSHPRRVVPARLRRRMSLAITAPPGGSRSRRRGRRA